jgi:Fe-S cluster assembly protein SufD
MTQTVTELPAYSSLTGRVPSTDEPAWLDALRSEAEAIFSSIGIPTTQDEEWRFTPLAALSSVEFAPPADVREPSARLLAAVPPTFGGWRVVVVNGRITPGASRLPEPASGLRVMSLRESLRHDEEFLRENLGRVLADPAMAFVATNTARFEDAVIIKIADGADVPQPLELVFVTQSTGRQAVAVHPRILVHAGRGSRLNLIELHVGDESACYLNNTVAELFLAEEAHLSHYRVQAEGAAAFHIGASQAELGANAAYHLYSVAYGARLARADLRIRLGQSGAHGSIYGVYRIDEHQLCDLHSVIDHVAPQCTSWEAVKGILEGQSRGVFNGRIIVRPGAQKTDAKQTNRNLLLSRDALVQANPQLEIHADDVKCTHGATVGHLEEEALFYMRSRGIPEEAARGLLTYAFANDVLRHIEIAPLRQWLERNILDVARVAYDKDLVEVE